MAGSIPVYRFILPASLDCCGAAGQDLWVQTATSSTGRNPALEGLTAALDWWREAGVDCDFRDEPRDWLPVREEPAVAAEAQTSPTPFAAKAAPVVEKPPVGGDPAQWPQRLEDFSAWWLSEASLDHGIVMQRIAPRGPANAALMVLVDYPEASDRDALLTGPHGALLSAMLRAFGITEEQAYVASVLPRHTPLPDWAALNAAGLGKVLAHHITLAAPQRLLVLGQHISPLLGHDPALSAATSQEINHGGQTIPLLVAPGLEDLIARPRRKAALWQRWLDWTGPNLA
jgi:uracil-DNA glycosylase